MSDIVIAAIISVGGVALGAAISQLMTFLTTRRLISSEYRRMIAQIEREARERCRERRTERLIETLSRLLAASDPELHRRPPYEEAVALIHRSQLLLNLGSDAERALNGKLNELGLALAGYVQSPGTDRQVALFRVHGQVIDLSKAVVQGTPCGGA